jgi:hypothetical protein
MQVLSTRTKVSSRRFYESFTSNKRCKSYVRNNRSASGKDAKVAGMDDRITRANGKYQAVMKVPTRI